MVQILRETPETREHPRDALKVLVREVEAAGVGDPIDQEPTGGGYRQVLALFSGVLLKLAGANTDAAKEAVAGRSTKDLERLISAILLRMGQLKEQGEPVENLEPSTRDELENGASEAVEVGAVEDLGDDDEAFDPFVAMLRRDDEGDEGEGNPALAYLVDLADEELRRRVKNVDRNWEAASRRTEFTSESGSYSRRSALPLPPRGSETPTPARPASAIHVPRTMPQRGGRGSYASDEEKWLSERLTPEMRPLPLAGMMRSTAPAGLPDGAGAIAVSPTAKKSSGSSPEPPGRSPSGESERSSQKLPEAHAVAGVSSVKTSKRSRVSQTTPLSVIVAPNAAAETSGFGVAAAPSEAAHEVPGILRLPVVGGVSVMAHRSALERFRSARDRERLINAFTAALSRHFEGGSE